jgi:sialate O-acetylesterase
MHYSGLERLQKNHQIVIKNRHKMKYIFFVFLSLLSSANCCNASIKLPAIIASNMVLQQKATNRFWGEATANATVKVSPSWTKTNYSTIANASGKWIINIPTPKAGGPYSITFSDGNVLKLSNILIGEVWLCVGQSNMEMPVGGWAGQPVTGAMETIVRADSLTPIRMFTVEKNHSTKSLNDIKGVWKKNSPDVVRSFSAVGYYYAQLLQSVLKVPVGVICSSWGGSTIQAWMDSASLAPYQAVNMIDENNPKVIFQRDCRLYNAMIHPLLNYNFRGVLWYQGESNAYRYGIEFYNNAFASLISNWRKSWSLGDIPFYYAQIAPWEYPKSDGTGVAYFRELQQSFESKIQNTFMVTAVDLGNLNRIHPPQKKQLGERFAMRALANTYQIKGVDFIAPKYVSMIINNDTIEVKTDSGLSGLYCNQSSIEGFEIAGADRQFKPAITLFIGDGSTIKLFHPQIKNPVAARYGFKNYAEFGVFNGLDAPLLPFRTDNW